MWKVVEKARQKDGDSAEKKEIGRYNDAVRQRHAQKKRGGGGCRYGD